MTLHSFSKSLAESHEFEDAEWWGQVYREAFYGLAAMVSTRDDGWAQRAGIDRVITLRSGRTFYVDEKVRKKDWPDVILERWSDRERRSPGWIQKPLAIDYMAYAYVPSRTCLLFPFELLQRSWRLNGRMWVDQAEKKAGGYSVILAENSENGRDWTTESIGVPREDLFSAMRGAMVVRWSDAAA